MIFYSAHFLELTTALRASTTHAVRDGFTLRTSDPLAQVLSFLPSDQLCRALWALSPQTRLGVEVLQQTHAPSPNSVSSVGVTVQWKTDEEDQWRKSKEAKSYTPCLRCCLVIATNFQKKKAISGSYDLSERNSGSGDANGCGVSHRPQDQQTWQQLPSSLLPISQTCGMEGNVLSSNQLLLHHGCASLPGERTYAGDADHATMLALWWARRCGCPLVLDFNNNLCRDWMGVLIAQELFSLVEELSVTFSTTAWHLCPQSERPLRQLSPPSSRSSVVQGEEQKMFAADGCDGSACATLLCALPRCVRLRRLALSCCIPRDGQTDHVHLAVQSSLQRAASQNALCQTLTHLSVRGFSRLTELSCLAGLTQLRELSVTNCSLTSLDALACCPRLTCLDVTHNGTLQELPLNLLGQWCPQLIVLRAVFCDVRTLQLPTALALKQQQQQLQTSSRSDPFITSTSLSCSSTTRISGTTHDAVCSAGVRGASLPHLRVLDLTQNASLTSLDGLGTWAPHLREFRAHACRLTDINDLALCPELSELDVSGNTPLQNVNCLENLCCLTRLNVSACAVQSDVAVLGGCRALRSLDLSMNAHLHSAPLARLANAFQSHRSRNNNNINNMSNEQADDAFSSTTPPLEEICGRACNLENLRGVELFTRLAVVNFSDNARLISLRPFAGLPRLEQIIAHRCAALADLHGLFSCPLLCNVELDYCTALHDLTPLAAAPQLARLTVAHGDVHSVEGLGRCLQLTTLDVSYNAHLRSIAGLRGAAALRQLRAGRCDLQTLAGLELCWRLREVDVSHNKDLTSLAAVSKLPALRRVEVEGCH